MRKRTGKNRTGRWYIRKISSFGIIVLFVFTLSCMPGLTSLAAQTNLPVQSAEGASTPPEENAPEADHEGADAGVDTSRTSEAEWPQAPSVMAESGIIMEVSTGTILYEKNMDDQHYPASITKIMTSLLAIENCQMDEIVTVPHEAVYMEDKGSHIALDEGEELTVEQCLYAIMLASANDAAYSLAIHVGGTIENFADMMNARAKELGCENTNFTNPHGLPDQEHVTTAHDMAIITRQALSHDIFRTVSKTTYYEIPATEKQKDLIPMSNHHKMLLPGKYGYEGAFSGKVGYTVVAQNTLVTCAARDGMELICVTMKTQGKQVYVDTASLFDFGFENFQKINISQNETRFGEVRLDGITEPVKAQIDSSDNVVLPKQAAFEQLQARFSGENATTDHPRGMLYYTYGNHDVGSARVALEIPLPQPQVNENSLDNGVKNGLDDESITATDPKKKSPIWIIIIVLVVGAGGVFLRQYMIICRERQKKGIRNCHQEFIDTLRIRYQDTRFRQPNRRKDPVDADDLESV